MHATVSSGKRGAPRFLIPWLCIGAWLGYLLWITLSSPAELQQVTVGLRRYMFSLPVGLAAAGAICALLRFFGVWRFTPRLSYVSCIGYFGFLKTLGWGFVPWALIVLTIIGFGRSKKSAIETRWSLLLLHAMGTMTGLYMAFHLDDFLQAWEPFKEIAGSLWLLTVELIPGLS